jgi:hypothetical protein
VLFGDQVKKRPDAAHPRMLLKNKGMPVADVVADGISVALRRV